MQQAQQVKYAAPASLEQASALLAQQAQRPTVLAGGTDLLIRMRRLSPPPTLILDIKKIPELTRIDIGEQSVEIGAAVSGAEITEHPRLRGWFPGVVEAIGLIGSTQVQGRATPGGNLCNASPAADAVPALAAAGAQCRIFGPRGERQVAVTDFVIGPGKTVLANDEILVSFRLPKPAPRTGEAYLRFIPRTEMDIAVAGAAVSLTLDAAGQCVAARVAIGAVAPTVLLVPQAAQALIGSRVDEPARRKAAAAASATAKPIDDKRGTIEYRKEVVGVLTARAAAIALQRAKGASS